MHAFEDTSAPVDVPFELTNLIEANMHLPPAEMAQLITATFNVAAPEKQPWRSLLRVGQVWEHYGTGYRCCITEIFEPESSNHDPEIRRKWIGEQRDEPSHYPLSLSSLVSGYALVMGPHTENTYIEIEAATQGEPCL